MLYIKVLVALCCRVLVVVSVVNDMHKMLTKLVMLFLVSVTQRHINCVQGPPDHSRDR